MLLVSRGGGRLRWGGEMGEDIPQREVRGEPVPEDFGTEVLGGTLAVGGVVGSSAFDERYRCAPT